MGIRVVAVSGSGGRVGSRSSGSGTTGVGSIGGGAGKDGEENGGWCLSWAKTVTSSVKLG
jgi:hypothetical protein